MTLHLFHQQLGSLCAEMAHLGSYLPTPGSAVWRRDVGSPPSSNPHQQGLGAGAGDSSRVRHAVIRDAEIWEEPAPYVVSYGVECVVRYGVEYVVSWSCYGMLHCVMLPLLPPPSPSLSHPISSRCIASMC